MSDNIDKTNKIINIIVDIIVNEISRIAQKLPELVAENPKSFECGYEMGKKQTLLMLLDKLNYD